MIDRESSTALRRFPALMVVLGLILAGRVTAQTFRTLHSFAAGSGYPSYTNSDGVSPGALTISSNMLYGAADQGGFSGRGTIFRINTDATGFTNLHSFTVLSAPYYTNDGNFPSVSLLLGSTLYGTAHEGGPLRSGTMFAVNTDGSGFTNLHNFTSDTNGAYPFGRLVLLNNTFYGTASGGSSGYGTLFKVNTDGTGFTNLHNFAASYYDPTLKDYTNSDGVFPAGGLILSANTLYGTAYLGGSSDKGTVFKVNTDGTGFTSLHSFTAVDSITGANNDGANPLAGLIISGDTLYGTAMNGGSSGHGTLFKVNTDGTGFEILHSFTALGRNNYTNSDGANPYAELVLSGDTLFGTAPYGGSFGRGTVFAVNTDGSDFETLHHFGGSDGSSPIARLVLSGDALYGATSQGGASGNGTVFSLSFLRRITRPFITGQPVSQTVLAGTSATFSVTAGPIETRLTYQWRFNDTNDMPFATNSSLVIPDVQSANAGAYSVRVTNVFGSIISSSAFLTVDHPPLADASATPSPVVSSNGVNATVVLDGSRSSDPDDDPLFYFWLSNPGSQSSTLLGTGVVAVVTLPVGATAVILVVSDGLAESTNIITVTVLTTSEAVRELLSQVNESGLPHPRSLMAPLRAALASLNRGDFFATISQLEAFKSMVKVQAAPSNPVLAQALITAAQQILNAIQDGAK